VVGGCGAGPDHCDIHHVVPWEDRGGTDITNGLALCRRCHLQLHRRRWANRIEPDGTYAVAVHGGTTRVTRPPRLDDEVPLLPVATASAPQRIPRYDPERDAGWTPWDEPDVIALTRDLIMSRARNGDGHATTHSRREQLDRRVAQLERAA